MELSTTKNHLEMNSTPIVRYNWGAVFVLKHFKDQNQKQCMHATIYNLVKGGQTPHDTFST
ncbi:hypothetical protein CUU64_18125 [Bacillus sp. V5-8f]|nr:hypothetical protein CUU64_18125 [Bacillus sp. V5-8f]